MERFGLGTFSEGVTDEDVVVCYDMSLMEFEHSAVHDSSRYVILLFPRLVSYIFLV